MTISDPAIQAIAFIKAAASLILLVLFLLLYRNSRQQFLRSWLAGWALFTAFGVTQLYGYWHGGSPGLRFLAVQMCMGAGVLFLDSVLRYAGKDRRTAMVWLAGAVGIVLVTMRTLWAPDSAAVQWMLDGQMSLLFLVSGWLLWQVQSRGQYGTRLLAATLILHALHSLDNSAWSGQAWHVLRMSFDGLLDVSIGIAMAVLILEEAHARTDLLNEKLRRLTLITATATQTFNVDQVLREALQQLVESLGASHGLVRLLDGEGESAALVLRAAVGFSGKHGQQWGRVPADTAWARRLLDCPEPFLAYSAAVDPEIRRQMEEERLCAMVLVRLPGKDRTLGVLGIGSSTPRHFEEDEVAFLVNVANLLGLTVQNVWLFEQVSRAKSHWMYTFDSIGDPIVVHDDQGVIVRVNRAMAERLKADPLSLVGRTVSVIFHAGRGRRSSGIGCPYCAGVNGNGDSADPDLGGFLLASNSDFHDPAGKRLGTIHVLKDITERKRAEEMYRTLFENVQEGVFISTPEGRFVDFNDAFMRMLGYESREELMGLDIAAGLYVHEADRERLKKLLRENGSVTNFEFPMRRRDGEIITLCETSFTTRDSAGQVVAYQGFVLDVTERKQAEQEIRRRNRELMALNSIGQTLAQSLELNELLHRVLRQLVELFGVDLSAIYLLDERTGVLRREAAIGLRSEYARAFAPVQLPRDLLEHLRQVRATVVSGQSLPLPAVFADLERKEGIRISHVVVLWSKDRIIGALTVACRSVRDFSAAELNLLCAVGTQVASVIERALLHEETRCAYEDLRRAQEQLLQSEKMAAVGQLISGVAHELNNPLTAILGYGQLLAGSSHVTPRGAEYVDKMYRQAQRTQRIVQNLLSFARQRKPERLPVRLNQIIEDTLNLREYDLKLNNILVQRELDPQLPLTAGDAHQLQQVFLNILNNAVDVVAEQADARVIWIRTARQNGCLLVEFTDSGSGVNEPLKVFDPFYTTKPVGKGTGLGLSICYGIVREHGGEITVQNSGQPGRGATFRVALPLLPVHVASPTGDVRAEAAGGNGIVLLVDDEDALLDLEREILRGRCARVLMARSGQEALVVLEQEMVDLVVTDLKMPGEVSGFDLYNWILRHRPALAARVIFTMSDARTEEARALVEQSGCPLVQKPFEVAEFLEQVQRTLQQAGAVEVTH